MYGGEEYRFTCLLIVFVGNLRKDVIKLGRFLLWTINRN